MRWCRHRRIISTVVTGVTIEANPVLSRRNLRGRFFCDERVTIVGRHWDQEGDTDLVDCADEDEWQSFDKAAASKMDHAATP